MRSNMITKISLSICTSYDITYMESVKHDKMNLSLEQNQGHRDQTGGCQGGGVGGGMKWEGGVG